MDKPTYSELLLDPRWQRKRLEILQRDNFTCRCCHATEATLHVHHIFYTRGAAPWEYDDEALVSLCEDCHNDVEEQSRRLLLHACHLTNFYVPALSSLADAYEQAVKAKTLSGIVSPKQ